MNTEGMQLLKRLRSELVGNTYWVNEIDEFIKKTEALNDSPYESPIEIFVNYELADDCRKLIEKLEGCKIIKVIEVVNCKVLSFWVKCPKDSEKEICDMAFMTFIKNPIFQRRYHGTKAFENISEAYIKSKENEESV